MKMHVKPEGKQNKNVPGDGRAQLTKGPSDWARSTRVDSGKQKQGLWKVH